MLAGNLVSILTGGVAHAVCSMLRPQNYDWSTTKQITVVEKEKSNLPAEEFKEEKLIRAKSWVVKWGVGFTLLIVILWPLLSLSLHSSPSSSNLLSMASYGGELLLDSSSP